jgi:hypothetical protein
MLTPSASSCLPHTPALCWKHAGPGLQDLEGPVLRRLHSTGLSCCPAASSGVAHGGLEVGQALREPEPPQGLLALIQIHRHTSHTHPRVPPPSPPPRPPHTHAFSKPDPPGLQQCCSLPACAGPPDLPRKPLVIKAPHRAGTGAAAACRPAEKFPLQQLRQWPQLPEGPATFLPSGQLDL